MSPARVAVLLSGSGRTLANFFAEMDAGRLAVQIVAVVSSRHQARGVRIARERGVPVAVFSRRDHGSVAEHNTAINAWLAPFRPQIISLAGYLCFYIPPADFSGPVVNIHPALLPRHGGRGYYGDKVHAAVLAAGDKESGCTVHHVSDRYDAGGIIAQQRVPVLAGDDVDSLARRVFAAECRLYPRVLGELARQVTTGQ
ncbi:phosphoribosylglycinamide formyltransferase [bacterium DOLZORAL124_64_63]|nr:MAG: phosphoribosylglycinamide formyltransferase [bacterium DOLZORAL124_64_63]